MLAKLYPSLSKYEVRENTGSMSSNRLSMQISFAMWKLFELFKQVEFTISLDCIDDVVIFITSDSLPNIVTYQLKVKDTNAGNFELRELIRNEVFKKLYDHIEKIDVEVKEIFLVSNLSLKFKRKIITGERILLCELDDDIKNMISEDMAKNEFFKVKGLSNKFIFSQIDMSIHNHKDISKNKLNELLIKHGIDISVVTASALFNTLFDILHSKQNYEFSLQDNILTVLPKKSYSSKDFSELIENTKLINNNFITYDEIIKNYKSAELSISEESSYKRAIASFKEKFNVSPNVIGAITQKVNLLTIKALEDGCESRNDLLALLESNFKEEFDLALSYIEQEILFMNSIERAIEG